MDAQAMVDDVKVAVAELLKMFGGVKHIGGAPLSALLIVFLQNRMFVHLDTTTALDRNY